MKEAGFDRSSGEKGVETRDKVQRAEAAMADIYRYIGYIVMKKSWAEWNLAG
jgi:hypothetical protein